MLRRGVRTIQLQSRPLTALAAYGSVNGSLSTPHAQRFHSARLAGTAADTRHAQHQCKLTSAPGRQPRRCAASTASFDHKDFTEKFLAAVAEVYESTDPVQSSDLLRKLVKTKLLLFTDMRDAPEKFFLAHRLLATVGLGGFGIRFTVQFNLFAGSILGLASKEQLPMLAKIQEEGALGCFLLTEKQAGVLSGLIVETTADWDSASQTFILNTPRDAAAKNWISQGYTAELGVVIADLRVNGVSHGPHPFFMKLRESAGGNLMPGIRIEDMGFKTVANDLDNARFWFDHVKLPKSALLNKFGDIRDDKYVQTTSEKMRIEVIGQRLLTGRQAIAEAALVSARVLHMRTEAYARTKVCNGLAGERPLLSLPQVKAVFDESYRELDRMLAFTAGVEDRLNKCLRDDTIPDDDLVDAISVCKIRCIETAVRTSHKLRLEVGSYALMDNTGFELMDMFLCCKFAEGDSRILQQKLMRDRLKRLQDEGVAASLAKSVVSGEFAEVLTAVQLAQKLMAGKGKGGSKEAKRQAMSDALDANWAECYKLADLVADRHERSGKHASFVEGPVVDRFRNASNAYDLQWQRKLGASK